MGVRVEFLDLQELIEAIAVADFYDLKMVIDGLNFKCLQANFGLIDLLHD